MIRKVFCLLLAAMFALPCFALGEAVQQRLVVWTALPDGTMGEADEGVDYIWSYTDETRTTVWVQTLPESQINPAQVVVEIVDTDGQTYRFYDTLNNTEWLDFA